MIKLEHLRKTFYLKQPSGIVEQPVLQDVNLDIETGETMVIIGRSGEGKSVILKHIVGLLQPDGGRVIVDGKEISSPRLVDLYEIRKRIGILFQGGALFDSMTIGENIAFAVREHKHLTEKELQKLINECLEMVNLRGEAIANKMPSELSGGMRKRAALARVIAMDPDYILYDEPTTGLDPITSDVINDLIIEMKQRLKVTSIVVTHDMISAYKVADRISMLLEGRVNFTGTPQDIRRNQNPYIQQFIKGQRKLHYGGALATEEEKDIYDQKVDITKLKRGHDGSGVQAESNQSPSP